MSTAITNRQSALIISFLFVLLAILFPFIPGHESDTWYWKNWSWHISVNGLRNAYDSGTNYLPLYQYILWTYGKLVGNPELVGHFIGYLRCFTLLFDLAGIYFIYKWIDQRYSLLTLVLLNILNLAYSYNTIIWGQVDGIMATLCFAAVYFAWKKNVVLSAVFMVLALNMKLQSIVFVPLWGLLLIHTAIGKRSIKPVALSLAALAATQAALLFPFMLKDGGVAQVVKVITESVDQYPKVSMNAFNLWHLVSPSSPWDIDDSTIFLFGLSYKSWGLILFCIASFFALLPLLGETLRSWRNQENEISRETVWLSGALVALVFFFFNTQMHERYGHPAMIFIAAYSFYTGRFFPFILFCIIYLLHLEKVLRFLQLHNYETLIFHPKLIASLFAILIAMLYGLLYRKNPLSKK